MSYKVNIIEETLNNENFRKVLNTGDKSQLVVMDIKAGESIGREIHENVEQTLFILSGEGTAILDDAEIGITAGDVIVVSPGTEHDFVNNGAESMKIYTVYAPPNHIDGTVHETKEDAELDVKDEDFGHNIGKDEECSPCDEKDLNDDDTDDVDDDY